MFDSVVNILAFLISVSIIILVVGFLAIGSMFFFNPLFAIAAIVGVVSVLALALCTEYDNKKEEEIRRQRKKAQIAKQQTLKTTSSYGSSSTATQRTTSSTGTKKAIYETQFYKDLVNKMHNSIKKYVLSMAKRLSTGDWYRQYETDKMIYECLDPLRYFSCYHSKVTFNGSDYYSGLEISFASLGYRDLTDSQLKELKSHFETRIYFDLRIDYGGSKTYFLDRSYWTRYLFDDVDRIMKQAKAEYEAKYKPIE